MAIKEIVSTSGNLTLVLNYKEKEEDTANSTRRQQTHSYYENTNKKSRKRVENDGAG